MSEARTPIWRTIGGLLGGLFFELILTLCDLDATWMRLSSGMGRDLWNVARDLPERGKSKSNHPKYMFEALVWTVVF